MTVVVKVPRKASDYWMSVLYERSLGEYIEKIKAVLRYFDQYVRRGVLVEVDDDDREESRDLPGECLTRGEV